MQTELTTTTLATTRATAAPRGVPWEGAARTPRDWQRRCVDVLRVDAVDAGVVYACTGAGKSVVQAELVRLAAPRLGADECIVVTVPSIALVDQLHATLQETLGAEKVGRYYTGAKDLRRVTVTCYPSILDYADAVDAAGWRVRLWMADEAHRTERADVRTFAARMAPRRRLAFTATPYRAEARETLALWDHEVFRYTPDEAMRDGVLVPWRRHALSRPSVSFSRASVALSHVPVAFGQDDTISQDELDAACIRWVRDQSPRPGIVSAETCADADAFAAMLSDAGIRAMSVHSRHSKTSNLKRIEALRRGDLACVVHVNMLSEGVDLPWLRWGAFRERIGSRVRFVQSVGRYLRAAPEKTHADLWDPWDLFGRHALTAPAQLGEPLVDEVEAVEVEEPTTDPLTGLDLDEDDADPVTRERALRRIRLRTAVAEWVTSAAAALRAGGLADPDPSAGGRWRSLPVSDRQMAMLTSEKWIAWADGLANGRTKLGQVAGRCLEALREAGPDLRRGLASDAMTVLMKGCRNAEAQAAARICLERYGVTWEGAE